MNRLSLKAVIYSLVGPEVAVIIGPPLLYLLSDTSIAATPAAAAGSILIGAGIIAYLATVRSFHTHHGTPAPIDAPPELVIHGLYQYSRNPMYAAVILILLGETLLFQSSAVLLYTLVIAGMYHLFIVYHEEPRLTQQFGDQYTTYRQNVPRWLPVKIH